jgi:dolichol-phosphate mannosyltransferase
VLTEPGVELTVVVPTFEERDNIAPLIARLAAALDGIAWEVVFVDDDSPDGTAAAVRAGARADRRVRIVQRLGRRGLSSACVEGMLSSAAPYIAVMDADLQHDETLLPQRLARLKAEELDHGSQERASVRLPSMAFGSSMLKSSSHTRDPSRRPKTVRRASGRIGGLN